MAKQDDVPVLILELVEQADSGMVLDGTRDTPYEQRLTAPEIRWIPSDGFMVVVDEGGTKRNKPIRHLANCDTLDPEEQTKRGFKIGRLGQDKIPFRKGRIEIRREGSTIATYDYLKNSTYNADNPLRPSTATALYREVKKAQTAELVVANDELITKAKSLVYELRVQQADKTYAYSEDRIDAFCRLLGVGAESYQEKVQALLNVATIKPEQFITIVTKAEQTINTEVLHGVELKVISFDANTVIYAGDDKRVIKVLKGNLRNDEQKIDQLAKWFGTSEGKEAYEDFKIRLGAAQENAIR